MSSRRGKKAPPKKAPAEPLADGVKRSWISEPRKYTLDTYQRHGSYVYNHQTHSSDYVPATNDYKQVTTLDDTYETIDTPAGFTITLLPHQQVVVKAMLDLEQRRYISFPRVEVSWEGRSAKLETCAGVLSDKLGSGKTFDILAVIAWSKNPEYKMPRVANISDIPMNYRRRKLNEHSFRHRDSYMHIGYTTEVRKQYKKILPISLVFVSKSVIVQWCEAINTQTKLKVFVIENVRHLIVFYQMIFKPTKNSNIQTLLGYDLILIKNGNVTGTFNPDELKDTFLDIRSNNSILSVIGELLKDFCVDRVVLDDYDTLGIQGNAYAIPALFTWFVSATKKVPSTTSKPYPARSETDVMTMCRPSYVSACKNIELFTFFNIKCSDDFIDKSTRASKVSFYVYKFHNSNEQYIGLLGAMGTQDAALIAEALNGDAIQTAAGSVGIKSTSVADIFEKVLDNKWNIYKKNIHIEKYLEQFAKHYRTVQGSDQYSQTALAGIRKNIKKPGPWTFIESTVVFQDAILDGAVEEMTLENRASKEENGKAIARVKDNLKQGECPITCTPLSECDGVVIMKCCGVTVSSEAASWSLKFHKSARGGIENVAGSCPNCRRTVGITQLILIDKEFNIDDILEEKGVVDEIPVVPVVADEGSSSTTDDDDGEFDKYKCVLRIVLGQDETKEVVDVRAEKKIKIAGMLVGPEDKGTAPASARKVIIYSSYNETFTHLTPKFDKLGIKYKKIQGTSHQISDMVQQYKLPNDAPDSVQVLLISGPQYCAGLNLQNTTDLIYTHKIVEAAVESQVAGRAARFGREFNLRIHYVLYDNEILQMSKLA